MSVASCLANFPPHFEDVHPACSIFWMYKLTVLGLIMITRSLDCSVHDVVNHIRVLDVPQWLPLGKVLEQDGQKAELFVTS